jgi:hypothetical protein
VRVSEQAGNEAGGGGGASMGIYGDGGLTSSTMMLSNVMASNNAAYGEQLVHSSCHVCQGCLSFGIGLRDVGAEWLGPGDA